MLPLAAEPYRTDGGLEEEFLFSEDASPTDSAFTTTLSSEPWL